MIGLDKKTIGRDEQKAGIRTSLISLLAVVLLVMVPAAPTIASDTGATRGLLGDGVGGDAEVLNVEVRDTYGDLNDVQCWGEWEPQTERLYDYDGPNPNVLGATGDPITETVDPLYREAEPSLDHAELFLQGTLPQTAREPVTASLVLGIISLGIQLGSIAAAPLESGGDVPAGIPLTPWAVYCSATTIFKGHCSGTVAMENRECQLQYEYYNEDEEQAVGDLRELTETEYEDLPGAMCEYSPLGVPHQLLGDQCEFTYEEEHDPKRVPGRDGRGTFNRPNPDLPQEVRACFETDRSIRVFNRPALDEMRQVELSELDDTLYLTVQDRCRTVTVEWPDLTYKRIKGDKVWEYTYDPYTNERVSECTEGCDFGEIGLDPIEDLIRDTVQDFFEDNKPDPDTPDPNDVIQEAQKLLEDNKPDPDTPDPDDVIQEAQEIFEDNDPGPLPERPDLGEPPNLSKLNEVLQEFLGLLFDGEDGDGDDVLGSASMS